LRPDSAAGSGELAAALESGAAALGLPLTTEQRDQLILLVHELQEWNARFNLTAIREPRDMVVKHLLDSLSVQPWLQGRRIADVGTGAGFPGLPLAVVDPARHFTLIESTGKKARFVAHAVAALGLTNVEVANLRAEAYRPRQLYDTVVCRAVGKVGEFIRIAGHLCAPRGRLLAMKGRHPGPELEPLVKGWKLVGVQPLAVPGLDAARHVVELVRTQR
jgi:16S rRNA (guanine527-N7)-methyltransferase